MNSQVYNFFPDPLYVIGTNSNAYQSRNGNFLVLLQAVYQLLLEVVL